MKFKKKSDKNIFVKPKVKCISKNNIIFYAHEILDAVKTITYKCGCCTEGTIIVDTDQNKIISPKNKVCPVCSAPLELCDK